VAVFISMSETNNSLSSTVIIGFSKTKRIVSKLDGLTLVGVSMLYGNISMCRFPIDSYVNAVDVSVNGKILF
jgi:hypothetical protein